jgi:hypothetical protein
MRIPPSLLKCLLGSVIFSVSSGWLKAADLTPELLSEISEIWPAAAGLSDVYTADEKKSFDTKWDKIEKIGSELMGKGLIDLYSRKAGVERPLTLTQNIIPNTDPLFESFVFREDSREKGFIAATLIRDPRRTSDFLPSLRERYRWIVSHAPNDNGSTELDAQEVGASSLYLLIRGSPNDRRLVEELRENYRSSENPVARQRSQQLDTLFSNLDWLQRDNETRGLPFIRWWPNSAQEKLPDTPREANTATPIQTNRTGNAGMPNTLSTPNSMILPRYGLWILGGGLIVSCIAWLLVSSKNNKK